MEYRLKVRGTPQRHCFATLPSSIRDKISSSALSGSIVLKLKWTSPTEKISFIGARTDINCDEGYILIPHNLLTCINLSENILITVTIISQTTSYSTTSKYNTISLKPLSYEDWEIIQYNSSYLQNHLLEQIDVINDRDPFCIYIGDIKIYLKSNMSFRWGFIKLGRDTTIDVMPLKKSAKKTKNKNKSIIDTFDDNISDISSNHHHSNSADNNNDNINDYLQNTSFYQTKDIDIASKVSKSDDIKDDITSSVVDDDMKDDQEQEMELYSLFRIGSFDKYSNDLPSIPPNSVVISPNILGNDDDDDDDDNDLKRQSIGSVSVPDPVPIKKSIWDGFYEGDNVVVTFRVRSSFVTDNNDNKDNSGDDMEYKTVIMRLVTSDYIENDSIILLSEYDLNIYRILIGDYCIVEPVKLKENCREMSLVSLSNDQHFITINLLEILCVESCTITSSSDLVQTSKLQWNETSILYLNNTFKLNLMNYIQTKLKYICNYSIIKYEWIDNDNNKLCKYFYITLTSSDDQLTKQINDINDDGILNIISCKNVNTNVINICDIIQYCRVINNSLLPPLDDNLIDIMKQFIIKQYSVINTYPSHILIYGSDQRNRLQYISYLLYNVNKESIYPISMIHVNCSLYVNYKISDIKQLFNNIVISAKEVSPCIIILHNLDTLISYQKEPNNLAIKRYHLSEILLQYINDLNKYSSPSTSVVNNNNKYNNSVLIIGSVTDPSCLNINLLKSDIFHKIFCLNDTGNINNYNNKKDANKNKKSSNISRTTKHFNNNLSYLYSLIQSRNIDNCKLTYSSLKKVIISHCNKWFKYCGYDDILIFMNQCTLRYQSTIYKCTFISFTDIIIEISDNFIPPTMRQTFQLDNNNNNNNNNSEESWNDIGGLEFVKQELLDIFELPTKFNIIFDNLPLKLRSGVLLYGPSGCGKTMIAGCIAKKCGINLISVKGPELLSKYIGASEAAVRDVFIRAQQSSPCIVFFDEFESLAPKRGSESHGVTDRVVNQLLTFLDGVESRQNVYVLAASSRPDLIDAALLRPGRLDKKLFCDLPDINDRKDIISKIINNKNVNIENIKNNQKYLNEIIEWISKETNNYSGADLNMIFTIAQTNAFHRCHKMIMDDDDDKKQDNNDIHIEVIITRNDLKDAIKQTTINVKASIQQQKQQGLTGTFNKQIDINSIGIKSIQH